MSERVVAVSAPPGRTHEVARLSDALDTLGGGRGGVLLLSGEGGVGKTTLSAWVAEEARARDMTVLDAPCFALSIDTPYACLVSALGPLLRGERGVDASELVAGLHSLRLVFDGLDTGHADAPPQPADDRLATSRLHGALATLMSRLSARAPVVFAIDDLHWADSASIEVLHALLADLPDTPVLVVATMRPFETAERAETKTLLRVLRTAEWATTVDVGGLDVEATRLLVQRRLGSIFPTRMVDLVHHRSGGTPLVAEELIEVMIETGALRSVGRRWVLEVGEEIPVPAVADDLIGDRLERLGDESIEIVAAIAVAGQPVGADLLAAVCDRAGRDVSAELERLRRTGLVDRTELGGATAWVAHHPIIGEVAVSLLGPERLSLVHEAYEARLPDADVERRARHLVGAGNGDLTGEQVGALVSAGRAALERGTPHEACRLLGFAIDAIDDHGAPDDRLVEVAWLLGEAWSRRGEFSVAAHHLERARDLARDAGMLGIEVRIFTALQYASWTGTHDHLDFEAETASLLARLEAEGAWADAHHIVRSQLTSHFRTGEAPSIEESLEKMSQIDEQIEGDSSTRLWTRHMRLFARMLDFDSGRALLDEIEATIPLAASDPELHRRMLHERLDLTLLVGSRQEIADAIADERALAEAHGDWLSWRVALAAWDVAVGDGDLDRTGEIEDVMRFVQVDRPTGYIAVALAVTDVLTGREPAPLPEAATRRPSDDPVLEHLFVFADLWRDGDRTEAARAAVRRWSERRYVAGMPLVGPLAAAMGFLVLDDRTGFDEVVGVLERYDDGIGRTSAWAQILRGEASTGSERASAYADAADRFDRIGRPFDSAVCALTAAEAGWDVDAAPLERAHQLFRDAPAPWLLERLATVADRPLGQPTAGGREDELGLTAREREVAEVVAEGLSNREVASRLFISVRTVTSHLDHIYTKLGIGSRRELAALIAPGGESGDT